MWIILMTEEIILIKLCPSSEKKLFVNVLIFIGLIQAYIIRNNFRPVQTIKKNVQ